MQKYMVPGNNKYFFEFMNIATQSNNARLDERSGVKKNETQRNDISPVVLPPDTFWSNINTKNISFNVEGSSIAPGFLNTIDYRIQKNKPSNESIVSETQPVPVVDREQSARIKAMLQDENAESGVVNPSEKIIKLLYSEDRRKANILLNELFFENFNNPHIVVGVLHIISHFDYDCVSPAGPTMAIAAISHKDVEVKEYGVKCFENWCHKDGIRILKQIKVDEHWLQNYINLVIRDLKT